MMGAGKGWKVGYTRIALFLVSNTVHKLGHGQELQGNVGNTGMWSLPGNMREKNGAHNNHTP